MQDEIGRIWEQDKKTVVLITNDVDEGIYLSDRIIPLSAGPNATLGPSIAVPIPRPRDRKAVNHDPHFRQIRREVVEYLLGVGGRRHVTVTRKLFPPDIEPEDLNAPRNILGSPRLSIRRDAIKKETLESHS